MLLVILGAGASYDSVQVDPPLVADRDEGYRPPLANQLFEARQIFNRALLEFEDAAPLAIRLQRRLSADPQGGSLERELADFEMQSEGNPHFRRHLTAFRYYLQRVLTECGDVWHRRAAGKTNYVDLISRIEDWRLRHREVVLVVTFNYDTMLEKAVRAAIGIEYRTIHDYIASATFPVFKLHGSVNWGFPVSRRLEFDGTKQGARRAIIENIDRIGYSREPVLGVETSAADPSDGLFIPALSIPVERKSEFSCPEEHVFLLKEYIPRVQRILSIGWRATEANFLDILEPLSRYVVPIQVVNGDEKSGRLAANMFESRNLRGRKLIFGGGFTDFLQGDALENLLEAPITGRGS